MAVEPHFSARVSRAQSTRLAWAFVISLTLHLTAGGGYYAGKRFGWWQNVRWPAWLQSAKLLTEVLKKKEETNPSPNQELPLMFVDVNPAAAVVEPPKNAKYYSDKNSKAANPDTTLDTNVPKVDGKQTQIVATETVPREKFLPLQPSKPVAPPAKAPQEEIKAKPTQAPGDLTMAKPADQPKPKDEGKAEHSRPRTIEEYAARHPDWKPPSDSMKQAGGVKAKLSMASLDAVATPFGEYDAALIEAIKLRWLTLLEERSYSSGGKVVLQFHLHSDGRITDMTVAENTAGEVLGLVCQKAVLDPAPFGAWPSDMRRLLGDTRGIQFTFFYN
jgi:outer membrane biosynthesis protein TonB